MGRGAGPDLAPLLRRAAARRRKPEGYAGARTALLRSGDLAWRAARRAHACCRSRQLVARADHGAGKAIAGKHLEARARDRRAHHLSPQRRLDRRLEARSRRVSEAVEIFVLEAPVADAALEQLSQVLVDCVDGGASVSFMAPFSHEDGLKFFCKVASSVAAGETVLIAA